MKFWQGALLGFLILAALPILVWAATGNPWALILYVAIVPLLIVYVVVALVLGLVLWARRRRA